MTDLLDQIDSHFHEKLAYKKLIVKQLPAKAKLIIFCLLLIAVLIVGFAAIRSDTNSFVRACVFLIGFGFLTLGGIYRHKSELKILARLEKENRLESKNIRKRKFNVRLSSIQRHLFLKFNKNKLFAKKRELISLGEDIQKINGNRFYELRSPVSLISIFVTFIAIVLGVFSEDLPSERKLEMIAMSLGLSSLIYVVWLVAKHPIEDWVNSQANRNKVVAKLLIGLRYKDRIKK